MPYYLKGVGKRFIKLLITLTLILLISFTPSLYEFGYDDNFQVKANISFSKYFSSIQTYISNLFNGSFGYYDETDITGYGFQKEDPSREINSDIFQYFRITATIFFPGLLLGLTSGLAAGFFTLLLKHRLRTIIKIFSFLLVELPDFLIIVALQLLVIAIYKKSGIRIFAVATGGTTTALFLPILTLSIFPFVYVYRLSLNSFEEILTKGYIQTAYSKGLSKINVNWAHVFKNGLITILNNLPTIIMPVISNLVIVEILFNLHGLTYLVYSYFRSTSLLVATVFLIWIMVEFVYFLNNLVLAHITKYREEDYV